MSKIFHFIEGIAMPAKSFFPPEELPRFPLDRILKSKGMSLRQAALLSGLDRELLQDYRQGRAYPSWRALTMLASGLGLDLGDVAPAARRKGVRRAAN